MTLPLLTPATPALAAAPDDAPRVADFPDVPLAAVVGQWAFAPTRASLDACKADPVYRSPSYAPAQVVEVGPAVSRLSFDFGAPESIPNAYVLPIPAHAEAAPGDVVLASRYGNALELAVVTVGTGGEAAPKADFVTVQPYGGEHLAALEPGQWLKVDGSLAPGALVAVRHPDARPSFAVVVSRAGGRVFLAGFMGAAIVASEADVVPFEARLAVAQGDVVHARFASGDLVPAKVKSVAPGGRFATVELVDLPAPQPVVLPVIYLTKRL